MNFALQVDGVLPAKNFQSADKKAHTIEDALKRLGLDVTHVQVKGEKA